MTERWEYMSVTWIYSTVKEGESKRTWNHKYYISRPGRESEIRESWSSEYAENKYKFTRVELLSEFGADGWELVADTVLDSVLFSERHGWNEVGTPVSERMILKRRVGD